MTQATIKAVRDFFNDGHTAGDGKYLTVNEFTAQWKLMPEKDKEDLKNGIGDGTLNY